ncbi:uncharacterized protein LOC110866227 [Helianthus annuus]|uniref:uncharacterized protein LOC110866227 n=1 Tax=Helianthus annuus TaxID=4232 RepID=UPI000B906719|nr:uncharacterized protein LOC110866227 [Helianthus annuus]
MFISMRWLVSMSKLHRFNMFQLQIGGFMETFIRECNNELREDVDQLIEIINEAEYFDRMTTSSHFEDLKHLLKEHIEHISEYQFYLRDSHLEFLEEQRILALELANARLDEAFKYFPEMTLVVDGFKEQHDACLQGITNMVVGYENMTRALYNQSRSTLVMHWWG